MLRTSLAIGSSEQWGRPMAGKALGEMRRRNIRKVMDMFVVSVKMAIAYVNGGDEKPRTKAMHIYRDVLSSHWSFA